MKIVLHLLKLLLLNEAVRVIFNILKIVLLLFIIFLLFILLLFLNSFICINLHQLYQQLVIIEIILTKSVKIRQLGIRIPINS